MISIGIFMKRHDVVMQNNDVDYEGVVMQVRGEGELVYYPDKRGIYIAPEKLLRNIMRGDATRRQQTSADQGFQGTS